MVQQSSMCVIWLRVMMQSFVFEHGITFTILCFKLKSVFSYLVMLFGTRTSVKQDLLFYIDISDQICYIKACLFCYFINAVWLKESLLNRPSLVMLVLVLHRHHDWIKGTTQLFLTEVAKCYFLHLLQFCLVILNDRFSWL